MSRKTARTRALASSWHWLPAAVAITMAFAWRGFAQQPARGPNRPSANPAVTGAVPPREVPLPRAAVNPSSLRRPPAVGPAVSRPDNPEGSFSGGDVSSPEAELIAAPAANVFATKFDDPPPHPGGTVDVATFNGVQPGETSAAQLTEKWGEGRTVSRDENETVLSFTVEKFPRVDVTIADDIVRMIVVNLDQPLPADMLARQLQLSEIRPVNVPDEAGELLGQAFPERGVLFSFAPDGRRVSHIVLDKIDLATFVLRAENDLESHTRSSLSDLDYVLSREPRIARALWLRSRVLAQTARYDEALADVDAALAIEPKQPIYRLARGEVLGHLGKFEEAGKETKDAMGIIGISEEMKAKALCQLGDLLAASPAHDYKLAIEHHMSAVKMADPLSIDKRLTVRRAAKLILVDAHLAVANDIAGGAWQQKDRVVSKWLDRANAYAEDLIAHEDGDSALRLRVARGALAACAAAKGKIDSIPWARMALQHGKPLVAAADDPWTLLRLQWDLGLALSDGLAADEFRGAVQHALPNTALTVTYLETGAKGRRENPDDAFRLGWLYYRLGSLHAVRRGDHKTAVAWYEKSYPLLDRPIPSTHRNEQHRYGEWLVSMGISYWEAGLHDFAVQLTDAGLQHVQEAINRKLVDEKALAIPYSNLAFMHHALGHMNEAQNFSQLAAKFDTTSNLKR